MALGKECLPRTWAIPIPLTLHLKVVLFRVLERLAILRQRVRSEAVAALPIDNPKPSAAHLRGSLWVFASTIGELNLIDPLLRRLLADLPGIPLTLISDRRVYRESYQQKYPDAYVYCYSGDTADTLRLAALTPPLGGVIVEIPCLPSDAPCRFPFAALYELRRKQAPAVLVNGWLYAYRPPSQLDRLERRWFMRDYLESLNLITVQTEEIRTRLIAAGADPARVHVTGNTKFDAMLPENAWSPGGRPSAVLLAALAAGRRPIIVAGCVTDPKDQETVLDAFSTVLQKHPDALLVLAPRHPENTERMVRLKGSLQQHGIPAVFRKMHGDRPISAETCCLVLDTFGELRDFYAVATVAFVGRNHNLLEPLAFGKPTMTAGTWEPTYPSFPVYLALKAAGAIHELDSAEGFAAVWTDHLSSDHLADIRNAELRKLLGTLGGATERNLALLRDALVARITFGSRRPLSSS